MANTYKLIASNTFSSSAASVTFSSIPGTYTDLILKYSVRNSDGNQGVNLNFNGETPSGQTTYSYTVLRGNGSTTTSFRGSNDVANLSYSSTPSTNTANTFSNVEIYIPSYTVSQNKPSSSFGFNEDNSSSNLGGIVANLWRNTAAITSLTLTAISGNFVSGSTFWLYGIKNS